MNESQKAVLQRHHRQLADDIYLTEDLLGALFQNKVFERNMIEMIRAEKTPSEQVYKMLAMLPRRGPDAFDTFLNVIKEDYPWLTATLEQSYKTQTSLSRSNSTVNSKEICNCGGIRDSVDGPVLTSRPSESNMVDPDIKGRVGTFIHKQFGQSKRISEKDKKAMERWFSEQVQLERKRLKSTISTQSETDSGSDSVDGQTAEQLELEQMQIKLDQLYAKLRQKNTSTEVNNNGEIEEISVTPGLASFHMVDVEVDNLMAKLEQLETTVNQSYLILSDTEHKHPLTTLIQDLQYEKTQQEKELHKEKNKIEKMLTELYDYSKTINKLEVHRNQLRVQVDNRGSEIERMTQERDELITKCKMLEAQNLQHIEKEKTLENLRKMVKELRSSRDNIIDENMNFRNRLTETQVASQPSRSTNTFRRSTRGPLGVGRRGSIVESNFNTNMRRTVTKTTLNTRRSKPTSYKP